MRKLGFVGDTPLSVTLTFALTGETYSKYYRTNSTPNMLSL